MEYLIYLAGFVICVIYGIGVDKISNFIDSISFCFVVIPCVLIIISTGYWKGFIRAFICIFDQKKVTKEQIKESAKAVKLVCISSLIFGGLGIIISLVNALRSFDLRASQIGADIGADVSVALITIFYAFIINAILVPLYFKLKIL